MVNLIAMACLRIGRPGRRAWSSDSDDRWTESPLSLLAVVLLLIATYFTFREFQFLILGKATEATVVGTHMDTTPTRYRHRRHWNRVIVYRFDDGGASRQEHDIIPMSRPIPKEMVDIVFLPGRGGSRLASNHNYGSMLCFFVAFAFASITLFRVWNESAELERAPGDRTRRRQRSAKPQNWQKIR